MKLTKKSLTFFILEDIAWFGNLPYSALSLFPKNYESLQDAVQKLIRVGYVAAIPTNPGKVLHITREGKAQLGRKLELYGEIPCFAEIQYDPKKALREGRINESRIMFGCAGIEEAFHPAHWVRRHLTQKEARGGDLIKYSRFTGIFKREKACSVVYHFGRKNITWNKNGEDNIATVAREIFGPPGASASDYPVSRLILANKMDSLENIVRFSGRYAAMPKSKRRFINAAARPFVIKNDWNVSEPYAFFILLDRKAMPVLRCMQDSAWTEFIHSLEREFVQKYEVVNLLDCWIDSWIDAQKPSYYDSPKPKLFFCYDWQEELFEKLFSDMAERYEMNYVVFNAYDIDKLFREKYEDIHIKIMPFPPIS